MTVPYDRDTAELSIKAVDSFALRVYRRARTSGLDFENVAVAVRSLQKALGHLQAEAQDPDSPLNQPSSASHEPRSGVYARQLTSIVEDSNFALEQVETVLEKYGSPAKAGASRRDVDAQQKHNEIDLIQKEVISQKTKIGIFLDTVQLHNPARTKEVLDKTDSGDLDKIKDKLDAVAARVLRTRGSPVDGSDDDVWQDFKKELEREGFSSEVLRKNKVGSPRSPKRNSVGVALIVRNRRSSEPISARSNRTSDWTMDHRRPFVVCSPTTPRRR